MTWLKVVARKWEGNREVLTWARNWKDAKELKRLFRDKDYDDITVTRVAFGQDEEEVYEENV